MTATETETTEHGLRMTYDSVTWVGEDEEPDTESGWLWHGMSVDEPPEPASLEPDEWDLEDRLTAVDKAVDFLRDQGCTEYSSSPFSPGGWWSSGYSTHNWRTGEERQLSCHLYGFSDAEQEQIWDAIHGVDPFVKVLKQRLSRLS